MYNFPSSAPHGCNTWAAGGMSLHQEGSRASEGCEGFSPVSHKHFHTHSKVLLKTSQLLDIFVRNICDLARCHFLGNQTISHF